MVIGSALLIGANRLADIAVYILAIVIVLPLIIIRHKSIYSNKSKRARTEFVQALLDKGVDVNAKDNHGFTALIWAAKGGHTEAVQALLDKGADVNARDNTGKTALMIAASRGHKEIVQLLKEAGAKE